ncbi:MAG: site-specific integrase, partial [Mycobacterium sp.]
MPRRRRFGNIRRLPSGRWQVRYLDPRTGLQAKAPRTFETRGHAEAWLADRSREVDRDVWNPAAATKDAKPVVLFGDYAQRWLDTRTVAGHPLRPRTKRLYQGLLTNHLLPAFSNTPLAGIAAADVRDWHAGLCLDAPTCRAHCYALLRAILNTAVADELIDANPCRVR